MLMAAPKERRAEGENAGKGKRTGLKHEVSEEKEEETGGLAKEPREQLVQREDERPRASGLHLGSLSRTSCMALRKLAF